MNNIELFREKMPLSSGEAALVEDALNTAWLTGTDIDTGVLLITANKAYFMTDFRYIEVARRFFEPLGIDVIMQEKFSRDLAALLKDEGIHRLHIEAQYQTISKADEYKKCCDEVVTDGRIDNALIALRSVKQPHEIEKICAAQSITDDAFTHILPYIKPGVKERDIALEIEYFMRKSGASGVSFDLITVTGKKTSLPHGVPGDDEVKSGDFVTMDIGCKYLGYCSDMTRTVAVGSITDEQKRVYDTVLCAQKAAIEYIKPGITGADADRCAREIINDAGYEGCFGHSLGHGVGLFIHEQPRLSSTCNDKLVPGNVVTVEPGIYLENRFGVRIEDMGVITETGFDDFTHSEKELIIL